MNALSHKLPTGNLFGFVEFFMGSLASKIDSQKQNKDLYVYALDQTPCKEEENIIESISEDISKQVVQNLTVAFRVLNDKVAHIPVESATKTLSDIEKAGITYEVVKTLLDRTSNFSPDDINHTLAHFSTVSLLEEVLSFINELKIIVEKKVTEEEATSYWAKELKKKGYRTPVISGQKALDFLADF